MTKSSSVTRAWQLRRLSGSSPQALSSMSSSSSVLSASESKPSRTMQWQVVQAQDFSQACSISMPLRRAASRMVSPVSASTTTPSGHRSWWGRKTIFGILNLVHGLAFQRDTDRLIHTTCGEFLGLCVDIFNRFFDCIGIIACRSGAHLLRGVIDSLTLCGA